jgi:hypothetical protein
MAERATRTGLTQDWKSGSSTGTNSRCLWVSKEPAILDEVRNVVHYRGRMAIPD